MHDHEDIMYDYEAYLSHCLSNQTKDDCNYGTDYSNWIENDEERKQRREERARIRSLYENWRKNNAVEVKIWEDSKEYVNIDYILSADGLMRWYKWYTKREEENALIKEANTEISIVKNLIEIDVINTGIKQFFIEHPIRKIMQIIDLFKNSNPNVTQEFQTIEPDIYDDWNWDLYDYFQEKAFNEYLQILLRGDHMTIKVNGFFLGHKIPQDKRKEYADLRLNKIFIEFDLSDIRKLQLWVMNGNALKWDEWAYKNFRSWCTLIKHAWSKQYQEVWWGEHGEQTTTGDANYYKWREKNGTGLFSQEFKRRLILKKLAELHYKGGNVFNNHLALIKRDEKYGYMNEDGLITIKPQFDDANNFKNGTAPVKIGELSYLKYVPEIRDCISVEYGGQWGFINENGEYIIPPKFDNIVMAKNNLIIFSEGGQIDKSNDCIKNSKWGLMNDQFFEIIPAKYSYLRQLDNGLFAAAILIGTQYKWGLLSAAGKEITPFKYSQIYNSDNNYIIANIGSSIQKHYDETLQYHNGIWGYLDMKGNEIKPFIFAEYLDDFLYKDELVGEEVEYGNETNVQDGDYSDMPEESHHYSEYAGSYAQDVMGYSDEDIDTIFDGDPDAYWNID